MADIKAESSKNSSGFLVPEAGSKLRDGDFFGIGSNRSLFNPSSSEGSNSPENSAGRLFPEKERWFVNSSRRLQELPAQEISAVLAQLGDILQDASGEDKIKAAGQVIANFQQLAKEDRCLRSLQLEVAHAVLTKRLSEAKNGQGILSFSSSEQESSQREIEDFFTRSWRNVSERSLSGESLEKIIKYEFPTIRYHLEKSGLRLDILSSDIAPYELSSCCISLLSTLRDIGDFAKFENFCLEVFDLYSDSPEVAAKLRGEEQRLSSQAQKRVGKFLQHNSSSHWMDSAAMRPSIQLSSMNADEVQQTTNLLVADELSRLKFFEFLKKTKTQEVPGNLGAVIDCYRKVIEGKGQLVSDKTRDWAWRELKENIPWIMLGGAAAKVTKSTLRLATGRLLARDGAAEMLTLGAELMARSAAFEAVYSAGHGRFFLKEKKPQ